MPQQPDLLNAVGQLFGRRDIRQCFECRDRMVLPSLLERQVSQRLILLGLWKRACLSKLLSEGARVGREFFRAQA